MIEILMRDTDQKMQNSCRQKRKSWPLCFKDGHSLVCNYDQIHINQFPVLFKESFSANPHSFVQDRLTFVNSKKNIFWPIVKMLFPETNFCCMFQTDHHFVGIVDHPEKNLELKLLPFFFIDQTSSFEPLLILRTSPLIQFSLPLMHLVI